MRKFILFIFLLIGCMAYSQGNNLNNVMELRKDINSVIDEFEVYLSQIDEMFNEDFIFYLNKRGDVPIKGLAIGDVNGKWKCFKAEFVNDEFKISPIKFNFKKNKGMMSSFMEEKKNLSEALHSGVYIMDNQVLTNEWEYFAYIEKSNNPEISGKKIKILKFGRIFFDYFSAESYPDIISKMMLRCFVFSCIDFQ